MNNQVQAACLPSSADYLKPAEQNCSTSGWGTLQSQGSSPNELHWVNVPAITNSECNKADAYNGAITESMMCAGFPGTGGKDACQGDSGGPFICDDNGKAVVAGVVSWGYGCAEAKYPGVYSRNTEALQWIKDNMV